MNGLKPRIIRRRFILLLYATIAWSLLWTAKVSLNNFRFSMKTIHKNIGEEACLEAMGDRWQAISRPLRNFAAGYLWLKIIEYIHFGPSRSLKISFQAGGYAGNTEIIPLLELVIDIDPARTEAYAILSRNLALHLNRFTDAIRLLQRGILANPKSPDLHELYASIGFMYAFGESYSKSLTNNRTLALRYFKAALQHCSQTANDRNSPDTFFRPEVYNILCSRFLLENGKKQEAREAWKAAGTPKGTDGGLLGKYFELLEAGESVPELPEDLAPEILNSVYRNSKQLPADECLGHEVCTQSSDAEETDKPAEGWDFQLVQRPFVQILICIALGILIQLRMTSIKIRRR